MLVPAAQRERSLNVGAHKILTENPTPLPEQLGEDLIEIGVRGDDGGYGHEPTVRGDVVDPRPTFPLRGSRRTRWPVKTAEQRGRCELVSFTGQGSGYGQGAGEPVEPEAASRLSRSSAAAPLLGQTRDFLPTS